MGQVCSPRTREAKEGCREFEARPQYLVRLQWFQLELHPTAKTAGNSGERV